MADRDFYKILGVARGASEADIRKAYKNLARKYHPDRNPGDKAAEDRFKEISHASDILQNAKKRELYDEFGEIGLKDGFNPDAYRQYRTYGGGGGGGGSGGFRGSPFEDLFGGRAGAGGFGFDFRTGASSVEDILRNARRRAQQEAEVAARPKVEVVSELTLGFVDALQGGERALSVNIPGEGTRDLRVRIPAGVKDGGQIRLREQGIEGGDLVVKIHVEDHPFFKREDDDLLLNLPITVGEAHRGAKIAVPTPNGEVTLTVPKGAKSGAKLRLRGKGVATSARTGDLIVTLLIRLPEGEDSEVDRLVDELDKKYPASPRAGVKL